MTKIKCKKCYGSGVQLTTKKRGVGTGYLVIEADCPYCSEKKVKKKGKPGRRPSAKDSDNSIKP
jgi:hypothetical protein